jgi:hypothetical protein
MIFFRRRRRERGGVVIKDTIAFSSRSVKLLRPII